MAHELLPYGLPHYAVDNLSAMVATLAEKVATLLPADAEVQATATKVRELSTAIDAERAKDPDFIKEPPVTEHPVIDA